MAPLRPEVPSYSPPAGQAKWFATEVQPHDGALHSYVRGAFPEVRDVDDIVQESYLQILRSRAVHPIQSAKAFLFKIAFRLALNRVTRERNSPVVGMRDLAEVGAIDESVDVAESAAREEILRLLVGALATLPPRCREITILHKLKNVPQKEIAARFGISRKTVEEQVARGVKRCETYLRKRGVTRFFGR